MAVELLPDTHYRWRRSSTEAALHELQEYWHAWMGT